MNITDAKQENSTSETYQSDEKHYRRIGLWIIIIVFGGFGIWAAVAPLSSAALAPGLVAVESYRKTLQHLEGGIVKSIHVRDGDNIVQGQILLILDDTQSKAQLEIVKGQFFISQAKEARLIAQQKGLTEVNYPADLTKALDDPRAHEAIQIQNNTFSVRKKAYEGELSLYKRQVEQLRARIKGLNAQRTSSENLVHSFRNELTDFEELLKEGYSEKQKIREFERNLAQNEGRHGELISTIAETELQISETELKALQLSKDFQREVAEEFAETQSALFELRERMQSLQDTVSRTILKASDAGMILELQVHTLGAVIPPGGKILDIVPQGEKLIVEARVSPMDVDRVQVGQIAEVRFSAFKSRTTPRIDGKLISVSADRLMDENVQNPEPYYLARVEISQEGIASLLKSELTLLPGMPAEVLINTGERTMLEYLFDPLTDAVARSFIED
ncbi:MAG: HlyD family type I secretion periplasmic adaptor subunit [Methylomicrobium sp.]|nr:HlyD family type I secretion periplasmic adaptor subunit [Methylomicrobium sp.]